MEFKGTKWSLGGISGRMIKTNQYSGFVADVDTKANALLISKAPEMLDMLQIILQNQNSENRLSPEINDEIKQLIKQATEL